MSLKEISIRGSYTGKGKQILQNFLLPTLKESVKYDRITGYFTIESLLAISQGIETIFEKKGKMRLIIGIHSIPIELIDAVSMKEALKEEIEAVRKEIKERIISLESALDKNKIATLSWMIEDGLLEVKAAAVRGTGIFHPKTLIFTDSLDNEVVAVGSSNETGNGLGGNFEQLMVAKSWENQDAVDDQKAFFASLWNNQVDGVYVEDISEETREMIESSIGNDIQRPDRLQFEENIIKKMSEMPANFFVSGDIPSLYMHQERAVLDALSRWPVRVMLSDEVGLGKTFEAAAVLTFLIKYSNIGRVVILTPKSVLQQWQDELSTHFGLDTWLYDSLKKQYKSSNGRIKNIGSGNPLGANSPNIILMSAQYARGTKGNNSVFLKSDTVLPELLIVDEAHAARISTDYSGKRKKTQLYKMLESVSKKIPHIVLATATPMQKEAFEYHAMLKLLGLPKIWEKEANYDLSLRIISSMEKPDISDSVNACSLLYMTLNKMNPLLNSLTDDEKTLAEYLLKNFRSMDSFSRGEYVRNNWNCFKSVFIKLHPAKLLTVRNTRKSLVNVGYKFPERKLHAVDLYNSDKIELFYDKVNDYLTRECFSIERALYPDKKINIGFVRISYQQRVASSLYSCRKSLNKRLVNAKIIYGQLMSGGSISINGNNFDISKEVYDLEDDELLLDESVIDDNLHPIINRNELIRAISIEQAALGSLLNQVDRLLETVGDKKIAKSLDIAFEKLSEGDSVLLFSRYTDTIDALISQFILRNENYTYAIYTGNKSSIVENGIEKQADKNDIKHSLFSKKVRIVFCSDAASEGLNLQAARILINVDVPWTPARLEQRIGRIARLGQVADEVDVFNVWYPHSIEAKMYGRIQRRLHDTNLAIGEFPEVVATEIRNAVLNNEDNNSSLDELKNIRNSYQTKALELLWINENEKITASEKIRKDLINICKNNFKYKEVSSCEDIYKFKLSDISYVELSNQPGKAESISLKSLPFNLLDLKIKNVLLNKNITEKIYYFSTINEEPILFENILDICITSREVNLNDLMKGWPRTLVNPKALTLDYAIECKINDSPLFWK